MTVSVLKWYTEVFPTIMAQILFKDVLEKTVLKNGQVECSKS